MSFVRPWVHGDTLRTSVDTRMCSSNYIWYAIASAIPKQCDFIKIYAEFGRGRRRLPKASGMSPRDRMGF